MTGQSSTAEAASGFVLVQLTLAVFVLSDWLCLAIEVTSARGRNYIRCRFLLTVRLRVLCFD